MKTAIILFLAISLVSYRENNSNSNGSCATNQGYDCWPTNQQSDQDSLTWLKDLRDFRTAVAAADKNKVKRFFDLPLMNEHNEIWHLVYEGNRQELNRLSEKIKPFTAQDLDKHFHKLFPKKFITTILKLKLDELAKKGESETIKFKDGSSSTYSMYASVDRTAGTVTLALGMQTVLKNEKGAIEGNEEYGTLYIFSIMPDGHLKFKGIGQSA